MNSLRRPSFGLIARKPKTPSATPNHVGINAVGWALPVPKKLTRPSAINNAANTSVTFATRDLRTVAGQGYQFGAHIPLPAKASLSDANRQSQDGIYCAKNKRPRTRPPRRRTWDVLRKITFTAECEPIRLWQTPLPAPES